jgi:hypothetical protein
MDQIFASKLHYQDHEDKMYHEVTQPTEDLILQRNEDLRKNPGSLKDLGAGTDGGTWGRMVASIPMIIYDEAIRNGFALNHKDADVAGKEMHRFLQTEKGRMCLVRG